MFKKYILKSVIFESRLELFVHGIYDASIRTLIEVSKYSHVFFFSTIVLIIDYLLLYRMQEFLFTIAKEKAFCAYSRKQREILNFA